MENSLAKARSSDCLFSGPSFPLLMAHITRRHPLATPDDFLPGLIHHAPRLPPSSNLPALPHFATIPATVEVGGYKGEVVSRAKRLVSSRCLSGRRPRKDRFEEKKGAMGAIGAVVENARRIIVAVTTAEKAHENDDQDDQGVDQGDGQVPTSARTDIQLLDVVMSATGAREDAQREVGGRGDTRHAKGISNGLITEAGSTSVESSLSPAQSAISWAKVSPTNAETKRQQEPTSATQRTAEGVKRSERLRERERRSSVSPNSALVESPVS